MVVYILEKKRIEWIDYLGGFAMLLVFMQHAKVPLITRMILTFHMPLFFYISGFLFIENKSFKKSFKKFFAGKVKRLLVP